MTQRVYRWNVFSTYDQVGNWMAANATALFGGVNPSNWTDGNATAANISSDKDVQRSLFVQKGYPGKNALVYSDTWYSYSSTNGKVIVALFRVKNTTAGAINWTPYFYATCYGGYNEFASVALNGVNQWTEGSCAPGGTAANVTLSIPANRTSTVIFVSTSNPLQTTRTALLGFYNNSLNLPAGLEFVDDLETATGGYEQ